MENSFLNYLGFDPGFLLIGLMILTIILIIVVIVGAVRMKQLYRRYDYFMRGKDAETMEDLILDLVEETEHLRSEDRTTKETLRSMNRMHRASYQKLGLVRYNAFKGMGGSMSFAMAMLDYTNSGFVMNCVHSREGCYIYLKQIECGETDTLLGNEEKEALEQALGYTEKTFNMDDIL